MTALILRNQVNGTLTFQSSLPCLPVPSLEETFTLCLRSLEPVLTQQQLAAAKATITAFLKPGDLGEVLQRRLLNAAARETASNGN
jgi:carnitine O-acetyltransferase